ncbi:hypothetical protein PV08_08667 [Exophiala spinifera]|uniref:Acyltransferase 3 domain-containing protein n=1 Tax=Exophiala spinifera TaxID=91928 RepID=A0A0D2BQR6_9EURO|nr:uncharacterized protein PV08_08667 [Exophiala spinifera]KIW13479.1 hypothetical protein PV08_08667 [Exophiala spinifera]
MAEEDLPIRTGGDVEGDVEGDVDGDRNNHSPIKAEWNSEVKHEETEAVVVHVKEDDDLDSEDVPLLTQSDEGHIDDIPLLNPLETEQRKSAYLNRKFQWHLSYLKELPLYLYTCLQATGRLFISALPTYCVPSRIPPPRPGPTAYLDALRGYAAVIVYIFHLYDKRGDLSWRRYPFVSTFFAGSGMVNLFYVISGHVLGYGLLLTMHRKEEGRMLQGLASALFRRYMRLYGSVVVALIITLILLRLRLYNGVYFNKIYFESIDEQLKNWFVDLFKFCNPLSPRITDIKDDKPLASAYLPQMWTIPVEFRGSVFLFAFCAAICKLTAKARMVVMGVVILMAYCWQAVYIAEFTGGLLIAQLSLVRHPERISEPSPLAMTETTDAEPTPPQSRLSEISHTVLFIIAFLLLGENDAGQMKMRLWGDFPWVYLDKVVPPWWSETAHYIFWLGWGSLGLVYALEFCPRLQRPLEWRVSQYIGEICFGLYAMHVPVGMGLQNQYMNSWRNEWAGEAIWGYLVEALVLTFIVVTAGDYFTRIDRAVVRLARSLQERLFTKW